MNHLQHLITELEINALAFEGLLGNAAPEFIHWRATPEKWNLVEIACHLRDEEVEDFRQRVKQILEQPEVPPPPIDPQGWILSRHYDSQDYGNVVADFLAERRASIAWLRSLQSPNWDNAWQHPRVGPVTARLIFTNWIAHDYHHIRQINNLKYAYLRSIAVTPLDYAGEW